MIATWFVAKRGLAMGFLVGAISPGSALPNLIKAWPGAAASGLWASRRGFARARASPPAYGGYFRPLSMGVAPRLRACARLAAVVRRLLPSSLWASRRGFVRARASPPAHGRSFLLWVK